MISKAVRFPKIVAFVGPISAFAMKMYWRRTCQGRAWKTEFPDEPATEIRRLLPIIKKRIFLNTRRLSPFSQSSSAAQ
jgi:hypothetical protein